MRATKEEIIQVLEKNGFSCFAPLDAKSCFDLVARKDKTLLLLKLLNNIDSLREDQAQELRALAFNHGGAALLIGRKSKAHELMAGVVYERYKLPVLSPETFSLVIRKQELPEKRCYKGRLVADLDSKALEQKLEDVNVNSLAKKLGVSRRSIYNYASGSRIDFEKAEELEELLDASLIKRQEVFKDPLPPPPSVLSGYLKKMQDIGFTVIPVHRGFDALASEQESLLLDAQKDESKAKKRAEFMGKLGQFFKSKPVFVMKKGRDSLKGIPVVKEKEISKAGSADELLKKVRKREKS
jgi:putative transcriptional regulator